MLAVWRFISPRALRDIHSTESTSSHRRNRPRTSLEFRVPALRKRSTASRAVTRPIAQVRSLLQELTFVPRFHR
jgi:hypothetical protein